MVSLNSNDISQGITGGSYNNQSARDTIQTIHNHYCTKSIQFYEKDIQKVIILFAKEIDTIGSELDDFYCPGIEEKNRINNLSEEYFNYMKMEHLYYFKKIKAFLGDIKNREYLKMYQKTISELQCKIMINKERFSRFEEIFEMLINYVISKGNEELMENRDLLIIFLHFMYWNCDIGDKYDKTS